MTKHDHDRRYRLGMLAIAAFIGAAALAPASPALADDEDRARDACRKIAKNRDWKDVDSDVRKENDNRIVITMRGERNGNDRQRRCVYDLSSEQARFED
jgi:hypothetical protein